MSLSVVALADFRKYFQGNKNAYGVHLYGAVPKAGKKEEGKGTFIKTEPVEDKMYLDHLEGKVGFGIVPVDNKGLCSFSVIDVDQYTEDTKKIVDSIYSRGLPLIPFRSKSGGLHLYTFYRQPTKAKKAVDYMQSFVSMLGLDAKTEIFPKQTKLMDGQAGSFINLPYYNVESTKQYLISKEHKGLSFEEAMKHIAEHCVSEGDMQDLADELPLQDAPPCLQAIYMSGETDFRNAYLFSLARYYKAKYGDDFEQKLLAGNELLNNPVEVSEVYKTTIASHKKRDYSYKCTDEPIVSICNKSECLKRRYGIGGEEVSELDYGEMIQWLTDPPYYEWTINEIPLKFFDESDITNQQRFRNLCLRELHKYPAKLKDSIFSGILNNALANLKVNPVDEDLSAGGFLKHYLYSYLEKRAPAQNKSQVKLGKVFKDDDRKEYVFIALEFFKFLLLKGFRTFKETEVYQRLREMGGESKTLNLGKEEGRIRGWALPYKAIEKYSILLKDEDLDVELGDKHEREPF